MSRIFKPDSGQTLEIQDEGGSAALTIDTDGNVEIANDIEQVTGKQIHTSENRAKDGDGLKLYDDSGTAGIFVEDGGDVGIGNSNPGAKLDIYGSGTIQLHIESSDTSSGILFDSYNDNANTRDWSIRNRYSAYGAFEIMYSATQGGETSQTAVLIDKDGNFGIPTVNASHKLQVTGSAGLSTGTAWTNTSDERIKTNIKTIENALEKINQLRPVSYNYSKDYLEQHPELSELKTYNSFVAQEYAQVFPDAVSVGENLEKVVVESVEAKEAVLDKDGNVISPAVEAVEEVREIIIEDMLQFTPHDLNMYLVGAIQELSAKVEALENA